MVKAQYPPSTDPKNQTEIITKFIKSTFKKAGKTHSVVPVSGGIDSATTLTLTTKALSSKNVFPIHLPSRHTNEQDSSDSLDLINKLEIPKENIITIPVTAIIQKTWRIIKHYSQSEKPAEKKTINRKNINLQTARLNKIRLGNITARSRMTVIFDQAKKLNALVVGTENKSEHLLGYYTRFGDQASDLEPIRHLYKTQLRELAKHLKVSKPILEKKPTAGLWTNQTDERELGFTYRLADPILYLHFEKNMSSTQILQTVKKDTRIKDKTSQKLVNKVLKTVTNNSFKNEVPYTI